MEEPRFSTLLNRSPSRHLWSFVLPLILLLAAVDICLWKIAFESELQDERSLRYATLMGTFMGQLGLCSAFRLRFESKRWWSYGTMLLLVVFFYAVVFVEMSNHPVMKIWSDEFQQFCVLAAMGAATFTVLCQLPIAIYRGYYYLDKSRQFTIANLVGAVVVIASICSIWAKIQIIFPLTLSVLICGLPTIVACSVLEFERSVFRFTGDMILIMVVPLVVVVAIAQFFSAVPAAIVLGQSITMWIGGIVFLVFPKECFFQHPPKNPTLFSRSFEVSTEGETPFAGAD
ncbi:MULTISPECIES: hypothetical protein [Pirellulaceae]|uniref:hypothetical protein n=1 Tax=Pirellulaceae TaxID=2691357 RepID=UPI0011B0D0F0|nr:MULTISPECIES: hypothetical protein [Pirellulaceae]